MLFIELNNLTYKHQSVPKKSCVLGILSVTYSNQEEDNFLQICWDHL